MVSGDGLRGCRYDCSDSGPAPSSRRWDRVSSWVEAAKNCLVVELDPGGVVRGRYGLRKAVGKTLERMVPVCRLWRWYTSWWGGDGEITKQAIGQVEVLSGVGVEFVQQVFDHTVGRGMEGCFFCACSHCDRVVRHVPKATCSCAGTCDGASGRDRL